MLTAVPDVLDSTGFPNLLRVWRRESFTLLVLLFRRDSMCVCIAVWPALTVWACSPGHSVRPRRKLSVDDSGCGDDIVHTDRVPSRSAHRLQSDDPRWVRSDWLPNIELKQRKHHVADGVAASNGRANTTDPGSKQRPRPASEILHAFG